MITQTNVAPQSEGQYLHCLEGLEMMIKKSEPPHHLWLPLWLLLQLPLYFHLLPLILVLLTLPSDHRLCLFVVVVIVLVGSPKPQAFVLRYQCRLYQLISQTISSPPFSPRFDSLSIHFIFFEQAGEQDGDLHFCVI